MKLLPVFLLTNFITIVYCSGALEQMNDDDLLNLIRNEGFVVVLFSK